MKENKNLKTFGLVVILTVALVFIGINFVQGQVKTSGKPDKPPGKNKGEEYVWSVVILEGQFAIQGGVGASVYNGDGGPGWLYDCSEPNIYFHMRVVGPIQDQYRTSSRFEIYSPGPTQDEVLYQIDFTDYIQVWDAIKNENFPDIDPQLNEGFEYKRCRFPVCGESEINCGSPYCMFDFMKNWDHPHQDYGKVRIDFYTDWSYDIGVGDFTQWGLNEPMNIYLGIEIKAQEVDGEYSYSNFNNIGFHHGYATVYGYIEKIQTTENTDIWKLVFGKDAAGNDYFGPDDPNVTFDENYWEYVLEQFNKKKTKEVRHHFFPAYGICDMQFEMLFIRTKQ